MNSMNAHDDYYDILQIHPDAERDEIREAYRRVALMYHPDKSGEDSTMFSKCAQAYDVLSDPVTRALYDMVAGIVPDSIDEKRRINNMKRADAERAVALMEVAVKNRRAEEASRNGLLILEAKYGDINFSPERPRGAFIDVSVALQCLVDNSALILHGGASKLWLEGFYDPSDRLDVTDHQLYVKYKFLNRPHECIVGDTEELRMPLQEHLIKAGKNTISHEGAEVMSFEKNFRKQQKMDKIKAARRRYALYSTLLVLVGTYIYKTKKTSSLLPESWVKYLSLESILGSSNMITE